MAAINLAARVMGVSSLYAADGKSPQWRTYRR
jgi:hypothetical protein